MRTQEDLRPSGCCFWWPLLRPLLKSWTPSLVVFKIQEADSKETSTWHLEVPEVIFRYCWINLWGLNRLKTICMLLLGASSETSSCILNTASLQKYIQGFKARFFSTVQYSTFLRRAHSLRHTALSVTSCHMYALRVTLVISVDRVKVSFDRWSAVPPFQSISSPSQTTLRSLPVAALTLVTTCANDPSLLPLAPTQSVSLLLPIRVQRASYWKWVTCSSWL